MPNIVNNYSSTIVTIFQDVIKTYENNVDLIKNIEDELNDINHEIELSNPKDMYRGYLMYKQIKELRMKRRRAKNENQLLEEMYDFLNSPQSQTFKNKIQQIQGSASKIYDSQQRRTYKPRVRNDLTCTDETAETYKPFEDLLKDFNKTKISMQNGKLRK